MDISFLYDNSTPKAGIYYVDYNLLSESQHPPLSINISMNFTSDAQFVTSLSGYLNNTFYLYAECFA